MKGADNVMSTMIEYSDWLTEEVMAHIVMYFIVFLSHIHSVVTWLEKVFVHWLLVKSISQSNNSILLM